MKILSSAIAEQHSPQRRPVVDTSGDVDFTLPPHRDVEGWWRRVVLQALLAFSAAKPLSTIPEDDIKSDEAASAVVMRARSDETQSFVGAESEQLPIHRGEEGIPRRRDRTLLEVDKEVPTPEDQATILRIRVSHRHMPLQAMHRKFEDSGVRPSTRRWVREEFRCYGCETRKKGREGQQRCRGRNKKCRACRVEKGIAGGR